MNEKNDLNKAEATNNDLYQSLLIQTVTQLEETLNRDQKKHKTTIIAFIVAVVIFAGSFLISNYINRQQIKQINAHYGGLIRYQEKSHSEQIKLLSSQHVKNE